MVSIGSLVAIRAKDYGSPNPPNIDEGDPIDKGASMCIMFVFCWKALGSPSTNKSPTILKAFDGRGFKPFGILNKLLVELEGKTITIAVEVVDTQFDYKLLLVRSWNYTVSTMVSSIFHVLRFPHQGKMVTVDHLAFYAYDSHTIGSVPFIGKMLVSYENVGVGLIHHLWEPSHSLHPKFLPCSLK